MGVPVSFIPDEMTVGDTVNVRIPLEPIFTDFQANEIGEIDPAQFGGPHTIALVPSCAATRDGLSSEGSCANPDPGVFRITGPATNPGFGVGEGQCAGRQFAIGPPDPSIGRVILTPSSRFLFANRQVCIINLRAELLKLPRDADPSLAGIQTTPRVGAKFTTTTLPGGGQGSTIVTTRPLPPPPPPPGPPAPTPCIPPPGPTPLPPGRELCKPAAGTARISGPTECVTQNFNVTVSGRRIRQVDFYLDGRRIQTLTRPNSGSRFVLPIRPDRLRRGTHNIVARTRFTAASKTRARVLRVVFRRCGRAAREGPRFPRFGPGFPRFTG